MLKDTITFDEIIELMEAEMQGNQNASQTLKQLAQELGYPTIQDWVRDLMKPLMDTLNEKLDRTDKALLKRYKQLHSVNDPILKAFLDSVKKIPYVKIKEEYFKNLNSPISLPPLKDDENDPFAQSEIEGRKLKVKEANQMRIANPRLTWKEIAKSLQMPERTLREWRKDKRYQN